MNTAPSRKQLTHERIVATAARAVRRAGFAGVGVAEVMKEAGLTHGGFYAHFPSRDLMLVEALAWAGAQSTERMKQTVQEGAGKGCTALRALVESYLSERHLRSLETGCPVAALASEMPRQPPELRAAAAQRVKSLLAAVQASLPPGAPADAAGVIASQLVGALQLARTLGDTAPGRALLAASRKSLLAQFDPPTARP